MTFTARYYGRCEDCGGPIAPGDAVHYVSTGSIVDGVVHWSKDPLVHDRCPDDAPSGEPCPRCFVVGPCWCWC